MIVFIVLFFGLLIYIFGSPKTDTVNLRDGMVVFNYLDQKVLTMLSKADEQSIRNLFHGKRLYKDNPSCGFSDDVSISFNVGSVIFLIARDTCPIVFDKSTGRYFSLSDDELSELHHLLSKYGFIFPCV